MSGPLVEDHLVEDAPYEPGTVASEERGKERIAGETSSRMRENAPRRLRGRNSHYGMDGRAQEVEIRKRVN